MGKRNAITILIDDRLHERLGKINKNNVRAFTDYMRGQALYFAENEAYLGAMYKQKKADEKRNQKKQRKTVSTEKGSEPLTTDTALFAD